MSRFLRRAAPLVGAALLLVACRFPWTSEAGAPAPPSFTVTGTLTMITAGCDMPAGYRDIHAGAQVVITDNTGVTVAVGQLDEGSPVIPGTSIGCVLPFQVPGVPGGKGFYGVEISHRGRQTYPEAALAQPISIQLG